MVRAKVVCEVAEGQTLRLRPVYDPNPESENGRFFQSTPGGQIDLTVVNESAMNQFKAGEEYYVDFSPVKKD